jgi:hypothetical protein
MKKILSIFAAFAAIISLGLFTGCEGGGGGDGGGGNNSVVGSWTVTGWEGGGANGYVFTFNSDGTFKLGHRPGTYSVNGNKISGKGNNPGVGAFDIEFTVSGDTFTGLFIEHWHSPYKRVDVSAKKQ